MYCKVCGKKLPDGAARCDECGTPVDGQADGGYQEVNRDASGQSDSYGADSGSGSGYYQDNRGRYQNDYYQEPVYEQQSGARKGFAIASLVLGIIGLVGACCSLMTYGVLNILLGVLSLIFGILGLKSQGRGMAIAGIVMACLNILIGILIAVLMIISLRMFGDMSPEQYEDLIEQLETAYGGLDIVRLRKLPH